MRIDTRTGSIHAKKSGGLKLGAAPFCSSIRTSKATRRRIAELTSRLYGGDSRFRMRQELLLGVGGFSGP